MVYMKCLNSQHNNTEQTDDIGLNDSAAQMTQSSKFLSDNLKQFIKELQKREKLFA